MTLLMKPLDLAAWSNGLCGGRDPARPDLPVHGQQNQQCHSPARHASSAQPLVVKLAGRIHVYEAGNVMGENVRSTSYGRLPALEETTPIDLSPIPQARQTIEQCEEERRAGEQSNSARCWDDYVDAMEADSPSAYSTDDPLTPWAKSAVAAVSVAITIPKILETIISDLNDGDVRSVLLVNRQWGAIATKLAWQDLSMNGLRRILSTVPDYRGELVLPCPSNWTRFHALAPCIRTLRIDLRDFYDSLLIRQLVDDIGRLRLSGLRRLRVDLHGYDRYQLELAIRFAVESVTACRFTVHFRNTPTVPIREVLKMFYAAAQKRMPRLEEFQLIPVWQEE